MLSLGLKRASGRSQANGAGQQQARKNADAEHAEQRDQHNLMLSKKQFHGRCLLTLRRAAEPVT